MDFQVGSLVNTRQRDWVVQPSDDTDVLLLKPLGGTDDETTGLFLGLPGVRQTIKTAHFELPKADDLGAFDTARLLFEATRLSFRSGAGPFRSLARLSFRPRSYQIVPLIMALRLDPVRLLIADDVGVGKTAESLLIVKELLERREIKRFAVICPPHLCDQWQRELKDKFGIDAVIIRSDTQARLDREIQGDVSVYTYYPYQILSIDYIKTDARRNVFLKECPELCIVDEVHTCANPDGQSSAGSQQQRYGLLRDLAKKEDQQLILLTATPHSGKPAEFQSLLGLLKPEFAQTDLLQMDAEARKRLSRHFVQRKRGDVIQWLGEDTPFPKRDGGEFSYDLSPDYAVFYDNLLDFAQQLVRRTESRPGGTRGSQNSRYWSALALLRGAMSSPRAGIEMLNRKLGDQPLDETDEEVGDNPVLDAEGGQDTDVTPGHVLEKSRWTPDEIKTMRSLLNQMEALQSIRKDAKAFYAANIAEEWLGQGFQPVIFCRYIATAKYVGELLKPALQKKWPNVDLQIVTSEDPDEVRRQRIDDMSKSAKRVLVCTDCLSEGINLQDSFSAVLHYDLPWNPNRLEQREGRVDRFGQLAKTVKTYLLYGRDNPIDGVVLRVIINKVREIRKTIGISMPFPEDSRSIADAVLQAVLINPKKVRTQLQAQTQLSINFNTDTDTAIIGSKELEVSKAVEAAAAREEKSRSLFAQHAIKANDIEDDLKETDAAIGNPAAVEAFVKLAVRHLGGQIDVYQKGYKLYTYNLPVGLRMALPEKSELLVSFVSPVPEGYMYIGRNHAFVENLCQYVMAAAMYHNKQHGVARASVIRTTAVATKTTVLVFRVRNVIRERGGQTDMVAEEMLVWGYRGSPEDGDFLNTETGEGIVLLNSAQPSAEMTPPQKAMFLEDELENLSYLKEDFDKVAYERAEKLVAAHERVRQVVGTSTVTAARPGSKRYQVVTPVLPMDVLGIYVLVPGK